MPSSPEQKQPALQKVRAAIASRLEWLQQHPLKGPLLAAGAAIGSFCVAPLLLDVIQKSDGYAAFLAAKPIDKLLAALKWLIAGTAQVPVLVIWVIVLLAYFGGKWWLKKQRAIPVDDKSVRLSAEIEELKRTLERERKKPANEENPKAPCDVLAPFPDHRSVVSFLFKFKNCTNTDLCQELSFNPGTSQKILKELEIDFHLIDRTGKSIDGQTLYALNDNGTKYATDHNMTPGNQSRDKVRASEAEKELAKLKQTHAETLKDLTQAKKERVENFAKVNQLNSELEAALSKLPQMAKMSPLTGTLLPTDEARR